MYSKKRMSILAIITIFYACASHASVPLSVAQQFQLFQEKYHKIYASPAIAEYRKKVFADNLAKIQKQNAEHHSYQLGINEFADQTWEEFSETHLMKPGWQLQFSKQFGGKKFQPSKVNPVLYDVDWRSKGAVTPVKNQGQCGAGWAFATTGLIEGAGQIETGTLHSLSEQEFLDCNTNNAACYGGQIDNALAFAMGGITTEADYPYTARAGTCRSTTPVIQVTSYSEVTPNDEGALAEAVDQQPIAIGIQADPAIFQFYHSGVISASENCGAVLNHALLVVGYTSGGGTPYWIVKNSWGASWGASGYVYIQRNSGANGGAGVCGIAAYPWAAQAS
jgi:C1A family cysteine protease